MTGGRSAILTYHSIDDSGSVISLAPAVFRRQLEAIAHSGIPVLPLHAALERPGSIAITFDDGFCNVGEHALPLLEQHGFPATIFVVSHYCGRENNWPSQPPNSVPRLPLLSWDELRGMPSGVSVGAHTATHPNLNQLSTEECAEELRQCQFEIEQRLGRSARWLAYPYGASSQQVRRVAARYFDLAVGTSLRFASHRSNRLNLPRIDTYYLRGSFSVERLFTLFGSVYLGVRNPLRNARRLISA